MKTCKGFTLFEVVVAVSLFALIVVITFSNLWQIGRSGEKIVSTQQEIANLQFAFSYLARDIKQMNPRKIRDQYGDEQSAFLLSDDAVTFTRAGWSNLVGQKRSNLQRVSYQLKDKTLTRVYWPQLDQGYQEEKLEQVLLRGIEDLSLELLTVAEKKIATWPDINRSDTNSDKPVALEIAITTTSMGQIKRIFELSPEAL